MEAGMAGEVSDWCQGQQRFVEVTLEMHRYASKPAVCSANFELSWRPRIPSTPPNASREESSSPNLQQGGFWNTAGCWCKVPWYLLRWRSSPAKSFSVGHLLPPYLPLLGSLQEQPFASTLPVSNHSSPWPDRLTGLQVALLLSLVYYYVDCVEYLYQRTLHLWCLETPMTTVQRTGVAP